MNLLFASANAHKVEEIQAVLPEGFTLSSLKDIDFHEEIPETSPTIEGNAIQKAKFLNEKLRVSCFADDTGLIIPSLNGEPGVISARYAGPQRDGEANMNLVLERLHKETDRSAYFQTVIALILENELHLFEGRVDGHIAHEKKGIHGFGYDPIFIPEGSSKSFAEMSAEEKNQLSHRSRAVGKMIDFLKNRL
jgi:XTP/dITP diphosphohydrolase